MEEKKDEVLTIPFVAHESAMNRMERANKRLWIIIIVLIVLYVINLLIPTDIIDDVDQDADAKDGSSITQKVGK